MAKWLLIAVMPLALAGCVTEQAPVLPMTLAPAEAAQATCLDMPDAPAFDDCDGTDDASIAQE
jgi:hypothetical protein